MSSANNNVCDVSQSLFERLRISTRSISSKSRPLKPQRPLALAPFRRRTESVNTVMSCNSMSDTPPDGAAPSTEEISATTSLSSVGKGLVSPLEWLEKECPNDIVPKILAFCGPQKVAALSKTNKHWNAVVRQEQTWRVMCEELYKVRTKNGVSCRCLIHQHTYYIPYTLFVSFSFFNTRPGLSGSQMTQNQTHGLICIDILPVSPLTIPPFIKHLLLRWNLYRCAPPQLVDQPRHRNS